MRSLISILLLFSFQQAHSKTLSDYITDPGTGTVHVYTYSDNLDECNQRVQTIEKNSAEKSFFIVLSRCKKVPEHLIKKRQKRGYDHWWSFQSAGIITHN
jgi:hypothetical protein